MANAFPISVLMSVHNGGDYLAQALDSVLTQDFPDFEFIVIDDASNDGTARILAEYSVQDPRMRPLYNQENHGLARSLNLGLEHASGRYIARMDADDVSLPSRLEKQYSYMENHPEVGALGTAVELIDSIGQVTGRRAYPQDPIVIRWRLAFENPLCHPTVMARRELLKDIPYDPNLTTAQDYDLWCRLSLRSRFANLPEPLLRLRKHDTALTHQKGMEQRLNSLGISRNYLEALIRKPVAGLIPEYLWNRQSVSLKQSLEVVAIMDALARAILKETNWSDHERKTLRRHASRWIFERARCELGRPLAWWILWRSVQLDPRGMLRRMSGRFMAVTTTLK